MQRKFVLICIDQTLRGVAKNKSIEWGGAYNVNTYFIHQIDVLISIPVSYNTLPSLIK